MNGRRQIRRQIAWIDKRSAHAFKHAEIQSVGEAVAHYRAERKHLEIKLESLEAARLRKKAERYGLYSFPTQEVYIPNDEGGSGYAYFLPQQKEQLYRMVADARFAYRKKWVDLLSPIMTIIISLIALAVSIIALYRS